MMQKSSTIAASRPLKGLDELEQRLEELFGNSFVPVWRKKPFIEDWEWMSVLDVFEEDDKLVEEADDIFYGHKTQN